MVKARWPGVASGLGPASRTTNSAMGADVEGVGLGSAIHHVVGRITWCAVHVGGFDVSGHQVGAQRAEPKGNIDCVITQIERLEARSNPALASSIGELAVLKIATVSWLCCPTKPCGCYPILSSICFFPFSEGEVINTLLGEDRGTPLCDGCPPI